MKPIRRSKLDGSRISPRLCAVVLVTVFLARAPVKPVQAATDSTSFGVGATVVAPCVVTPQFLARLKSAIGTSSLAPCMVGSKAAGSPFIQPTTRLGRDPATGLHTLTVEF
jgi:hypothetical protein